MYYIHDKNILVCIPPAITILATFSGFLFRLVSLSCFPLPLNAIL